MTFGSSRFLPALSIESLKKSPSRLMAVVRCAGSSRRFTHVFGSFSSSQPATARRSSNPARTFFIGKSPSFSAATLTPRLPGCQRPFSPSPGRRTRSSRAEWPMGWRMKPVPSKNAIIVDTFRAIAVAALSRRKARPRPPRAEEAARRRLRFAAGRFRDARRPREMLDLGAGEAARGARPARTSRRRSSGCTTTCARRAQRVRRGRDGSALRACHRVLHVISR